MGIKNDIKMIPKINIVVDTNLIFYKFAYVNAYKTANYLSRDSHKSQFIKDITKSIQATVNMYRGYIDRVIFVADLGKSWRKDIPVEEDFYKTTRNKDYPFDIGIFKSVLYNYMTMLREYGFYTYMYNRLEGDDLLFMISSILYHNGMSSVLLTSDEDARTLVKSDPNGKFITVFDYDYDKKFHYIDENLNYLPAKDDDEFNGAFDMSSPDNVARNKYNNLIDIIRQNHRIVHPHEILFRKIVAGDKSDNVPTSYMYPKGAEQKMTKFTEKRAIDIMPKYNIDKNFVNKLKNDTEFRLMLANDIITEVKVKADKASVNSHELINKVANNLLRNIKFVYLHNSSYADELELYTDVKNKIGKDLSNRQFLLNHANMMYDGWSDDLLSGTGYDSREDAITMDFRNV